MKRMSTYLNSIKSMYFMLLACVSLLMGVTSCSQDEFENYESEQQKKYSKAELIEQALSRMPQTRASGAAITMVTIKDSVSLRCLATENIVIDWGDFSTDTIKKNTYRAHTHTYTDGYPSHPISLNDVTGITIRDLRLNNNGLIDLRFINDIILKYLICTTNYLDEIDFSTISGLITLHVSNNELTSINLTNLSELGYLLADNNQLKAIDMSDSKNLVTIDISSNRVSELDLNRNTKLNYLNVAFNPITELDLNRNVNLSSIDLEETPITTLNNVPIHKMSFANFPELRHLNIAYTPFDSLDLSDNSFLSSINISGTDITQLDVSDLSIRNLSATRSKLTNLISGTPGLSNLYELRIERTPFENDYDKMHKLVYTLLPSRSEDAPGHFYSYSSHINNFTSRLTGKYWLINQ